MLVKYRPTILSHNHVFIHWSHHSVVVVRLFSGSSSKRRDGILKQTPEHRAQRHQNDSVVPVVLWPAAAWTVSFLSATLTSPWLVEWRHTGQKSTHASSCALPFIIECTLQCNNLVITTHLDCVLYLTKSFLMCSLIFKAVSVESCKDMMFQVCMIMQGNDTEQIILIIVKKGNFV